MPVRGISAGAQSSMALSIGGHVFCWGCNGRGRLGLGPAYDQELIQHLSTICLLGDGDDDDDVDDDDGYQWLLHNGYIMVINGYWLLMIINVY